MYHCCGVTTGSVTRLTSILLERQQQDLRSSIWLYYKAPDVPVNTMTALAVEVGESTLHYNCYHASLHHGTEDG